MMDYIISHNAGALWDRMVLSVDEREPSVARNGAEDGSGQGRTGADVVMTPE